MRTSKRLSAPVLALAATTAMYGFAMASRSDASIPKPPSFAPPTRTVWLEQGWGDRERAWYHHVSQGTDTIPIPYDWFMAMEQPRVVIGSAGMFSDPAYLDRFGFIPSPEERHQPGWAADRLRAHRCGRSDQRQEFRPVRLHLRRLPYRPDRV